MMLVIRILILGLSAALLSVAQAEGLTIEITKGSQTAVPIAIVPFAQQGSIGNVKLSDIISSDLAGSGFATVAGRQDWFNDSIPFGGQTRRQDFQRARPRRCLMKIKAA